MLNEQTKRIQKVSINELGEVLWDFLTEDSNYSRDMAKGVIDFFDSVKTVEEYSAAQAILIALTGSNLADILDEVERRKGAIV